MARGGGTQLERRGSPQPGPQVYREGSLPSPLLSLHSSRQRTLFGHCRSPACSSAMATIFDGIRQRQPDVANDWAISTICQLIIAEGERLAQRFKPEQKKACFGNPEFSVVNFLSQAEFSHHQPANYYVGSHFLSLQVRRGSRSKTWYLPRLIFSLMC